MATDLTPKQNERVRAGMRKLMAERSLNKSELADLIERKQPVISDFLNGRSGASHETARRVAEKLGVTFDELVGEREPLTAARAVPEELAKAIEFLRGELPNAFLDAFQAEHDEGFERFTRHDFVQMIRGLYMQSKTATGGAAGVDKAIAARRKRKKRGG
jgi:transcriptional regulator with XRE-family HTH domain